MGKLKADKNNEKANAEKDRSAQPTKTDAGGCAAKHPQTISPDDVAKRTRLTHASESPQLSVVQKQLFGQTTMTINKTQRTKLVVQLQEKKDSKPPAEGSFFASLGMQPAHDRLKASPYAAKAVAYGGKTPYRLKAQVIQHSRESGSATGLGLTISPVSDERGRSWIEKSLNDQIWNRDCHRYDQFNFETPAALVRDGKSYTNKAGFPLRLFWMLWQFPSHYDQATREANTVKLLEDLHEKLLKDPEMEKCTVLFDPNVDVAFGRTWAEIMDAPQVTTLLNQLHGEDFNAEWFDQHESALRCFYQPGKLPLALALRIGAPLEEVREEDQEQAQAYVDREQAQAIVE